MKKRIILTMVVLFVPLLVISGCKTKETVKPEIYKNVKVTPVQKSSIAIEDEFAGEITAIEQVGVVPKAPGKVSQIFADVGTKVEKGSVLFKLDPSDAIAQLNQANASVELARVSLSRAKGSGYSQSLIQAQTAVDQTKLAYDDAKSNYENNKVLYDEGAVSQHDFESIKNKTENAKVQYDTAVKNLDLLKKGLGPDSVQTAQAQLEQAEASLQLAQTQYNNLTVTSPIAGVVAKKNINIGEAVSSASPAFIVSNTGTLFSELNIPEKLVNKITLGQKLSVAVQTPEEKIIMGEVTNISPIVDEKTRKCDVKVILKDAGNDVRPGMFAKVRLTTEEKKDILTIPNEAVVSEKGLQFVYIVKNGKVSKCPIKIGLANDKITEVVDGLALGDNVILEGQSFLSDGEKVNMVK